MNDGAVHSFGFDSVLKMKEELGLPSVSFFISSHATKNNSSKMYTFNGFGRGDGIGMCQMGALKLAIQNKSSEDIISKYYPEVVQEIV